MKNKAVIRLLAVIIAALCLLQIPVSASSPYKSYVYDNNGEACLAPDAFRYESSIDIGEIKDKSGKEIGAIALNNVDGADNVPGNLFVTDSGLIYVCDTGNQRIIVLNKDYSFNRIISGFKNEVKDENGRITKFDDTFSLPTSVFIDERDGSMYICDQNGATPDNVDADVRKYIKEGTSGRVIQLDKDGNFVRQIAGVHSEVLPDDFIFQPTKMVVDSAGRIFILSRQCIQGIIELSVEGEFVQCLGAAKATYSAVELVQRMFMTDEQKKSTANIVSTEYSGITVDEDNFLYVTNATFTKTTASQTERLAKLNAKGKNVLRKASDKMLPYGDTNADFKYGGPSLLMDVMCLDDGIYAVLDQLRGKVFFYNADGVNLFEFGTTTDQTDSVHKTYLDSMLITPVSIGWNDNCCIVLDAETGYIKIYSMTDYAQLIITANKYHTNDEWDKEEECWEQVLKLNLNSAAAKQSIAKVYYRKKDYKTAMSYFKDIVDQDNYSLAYKYMRQQVIEKYFGIALLVIVIAIVLIVLIKKWWKKHIPRAGDNTYIGHLRYAGTILSRPLNGSWFLVRENHASIASATTILLAASIVSMLQSRYTGFIFNANGEHINIVLELMKIILPVMLFCICNWCVTSLLNGEGNLKAIYIGTCYSLTPIIILYPIAVIFSNIMVKEEGDFFTVFITVALALTFLLIFATNMRIHDFNPGFTVLELAITVVVMLLVVFLAILFFALIQQMYDFVSRLLQEIATRA